MNKPDDTRGSADRSVEIFLDATEIADPADQSRFIAEACSGDRDLQHDVELLLRDYSQLGNFLEKPLLQQRAFHSVLVDDAELAGRQLNDRYLLLRKLGSGGMGQVWLAEQHAADRRHVAVKLLNPGMDSARIIARFQTELRALSKLRHPHIAAILDGGLSENGLPFFVMEFVDGTPLSDYCDNRQLAIESRLRLFISVCRAVDYAHQQGVIHRDLKPGNILIEEISGETVPRVIDFGLARVIQAQSQDESRITEHGWYLGTPEYMAPEQMTATVASVDARADVYSLGVILFQLLTGQSPFRCVSREPAALPDFFRTVQETDAPRPAVLAGKSADPQIAAARGLSPRELESRLSGDLDWIALRAVEKTPQRRYGSAAELAADLERHLASQTVSAHPPAVFYRLRKFLSRRRQLVLGSTIALLAISAGLSFGTWALLKSWHTEAALERAAGQTNAAEQALIRELRASLQLASERLLTALPEQQAHARASLRQSAERWRKYAEQAADDYTGNALRSESLVRMGAIHNTLGEAAEARRLLELARTTLEPLERSRPHSAELQRLHAECLYQLAKRRSEDGDIDDARLLFADASSRLTLALSDSSQQPEIASMLALVKIDYAMMLINHGSAQDARPLLLESTRLLQELCTRYPSRREFAEDLEASNSTLAHCLRTLGDRDAALQVGASALSKTQALLDQTPDNQKLRRRVATQHQLQGLILRELGRLEEARSELLAAMQLLQELTKAFPLEPELRRREGNVVSTLGVIQTQLREYSSAMAYYEQARTIQEELVAGNPQRPEYLDELASTLQSHTVAASASREIPFDPETALRMYQVRKTLAVDFPESPIYAFHLASACNVYGTLLLQQQRHDEAITVLETGIQALQQLMKSHPGVALHRKLLGNLFHTLAELEISQSHWEEARKRLQQCLEARPLDSTDPLAGVFVAQCHVDIARTLIALGQPEEAQKSMQTASELANSLPPQFPEVIAVQKLVRERLSSPGPGEKQPQSPPLPSEGSGDGGEGSKSTATPPAKTAESP